MKVLKNNNEFADFDIEKLKSALKNSGASNKTVNKIISEISPKFYDGISTKKIYRLAFSALKKHSKKVSAFYSLKKAIQELGPTGYPFEIFISLLLKNEGYSVEVDTLIKGKCVVHEVDVVAIKDNEKIFVECKFHQNKGHKNDVKIPLYINSRFHDIKNNEKNLPENKNYVFRGMIATNTRFTDDAIQFGKCAGLKLLSWDYPKGDSLKDKIDKAKFHPVTCLSSANRVAKQTMLNNNIVICKDVVTNKEKLFNIGIPDKTAKNIYNEAHEIVFS